MRAGCVAHRHASSPMVQMLSPLGGIIPHSRPAPPEAQPYPTCQCSTSQRAGATRKEALAPPHQAPLPPGAALHAAIPHATPSQASAILPHLPHGHVCQQRPLICAALHVPAVPHIQPITHHSCRCHPNLLQHPTPHPHTPTRPHQHSHTDTHTTTTHLAGVVHALLAADAALLARKGHHLVAALHQLLHHKLANVPAQRAERGGRGRAGVRCSVDSKPVALDRAVLCCACTCMCAVQCAQVQWVPCWHHSGGRNRLFARQVQGAWALLAAPARTPWRPPPAPARPCAAAAGSRPPVAPPPPPQQCAAAATAGAALRCCTAAQLPPARTTERKTSPDGWQAICRPGSGNAQQLGLE